MTNKEKVMTELQDLENKLVDVGIIKGMQMAEDALKDYTKYMTDNGLNDHMIMLLHNAIRVIELNREHYNSGDER